MQVFNIKSFLEVTRPKGTFNLSEKSEVDSRVSGGNKNYLFIRFICEMKHFRLDVASHEMCFNQSYITSTIGFWFRPSWLVLKSPITIFQTILAWIISPCNFNLKELPFPGIDSTVLFFISRFFLYLFPPEPEYKIEEVGLPLHLTPFIRDNRIPEARDRAMVRGLQWPRLISYAGFLTVNEGEFTFCWSSDAM